MICNPCRSAGDIHSEHGSSDGCKCKKAHKKCQDNGKNGKQKTDYRGCDCQHRCEQIIRESAVN